MDYNEKRKVMIFVEIKEIIEKCGVNIVKGLLPMPVATIMDAINECESEDELKSKFSELKRYSEEYTKEYTKVIPSMPLSVDVEYASIVVLYYLIEPHNINNFLNMKQLQEQIELILDNRIDSIESFEVYSDYIILQSSGQISKIDWQNGAIKTLKEILNEEFDIKIKSILYA